MDFAERAYAARYGDVRRAVSDSICSRLRPSIPVLKNPGSTIDTFTPKPATSILRTSDSASSPNLDAWYQPSSGAIAARPNIDDTMTMRPAPCSRIAGSAHDDTTAGAIRF